VTGALLVFDHELEDILDGTPKRIVAGGAEQPIGAIITAARAGAPPAHPVCSSRRATTSTGGRALPRGGAPRPARRSCSSIR
jgi:uncharacterized iron-regulated membrane protein